MMFARHDVAKLVGTAVAAAALGLTTAGNIAADSTDDAFLRRLFADGIMFSDQVAVIARAHMVCAEFSAGGSSASVYAAMLDYSEAMTPRQTALFMADAVQAYCPRYADLLAN